MEIITNEAESSFLLNFGVLKGMQFGILVKNVLCTSCYRVLQPLTA